MTGFEFEGSANAILNPEIQDCLNKVDGIVICPANPFVYIDPLLHIPEARDALLEARVPVVAG